MAMLFRSIKEEKWSPLVCEKSPVCYQNSASIFSRPGIGVVDLYYFMVILITRLLSLCIVEKLPNILVLC